MKFNWLSTSQRTKGVISLVWQTLCFNLFCMIIISGCHTTQLATIALPARHSVRSDQLLVLSNFKLERDHELIQNLKDLRKKVISTLGLSFEDDDVVVYLFSDKESYERYLDLMYPDLPARRAYFVGRPKELAVFTYWGDRVQEDLRHEFTHGLLHANSRKVPLWLDEGLAEYFETAEKTPAMVKTKYSEKLASLLESGWRPDVKRLENLDDFASMSRADYREAWAWVHFMIHHSPDTHQILNDYLLDLKTKVRPKSISQRLADLTPQYEQRLTAYLANIKTAAFTQVSYTEEDEDPGHSIVIPD